MIKKEKNITANTNARIQKIPFITSLPLKALIPCNKGKNINAIELGELSGAVCDYFVICEGNTPTQVSALAESVEKNVVKNTGERPLRVHGQQLAEWIGMDYGNVIVHIFLPELRNFYNIDLLWEDARSTRIPNID